MQSQTEEDRESKGAPCSLEPHLHTVQFYSDDAFFVDSISQFVGTSLLAGGAAIVIATRAHRDGIGRQLKKRGIDLAEALEKGRYVVLDPDETLSRFLVDGWPDEVRFVTQMGDVIERAKTSGAENCAGVAIFGEMVSLLWSEGKCDAAIRLEQLWNILGGTHAFSLRCAYPITGFGRHEHHEPFVRICAEHSDVLPEENYLAAATDQERNRTIAEWQQQAHALESEIAERRKAERLLQRREAQLWDFLESAVVAMHWVAADGMILWANREELTAISHRC